MFRSKYLVQYSLTVLLATSACSLAPAPVPVEPSSTVDQTPDDAYPEYLQRKAAFQFDGMDVRFILEELGRVLFDGRIQIDPAVVGTFTGTIELQPAWAVLNTICSSVGCSWRVSGDSAEMILVEAFNASEVP